MTASRRKRWLHGDERASLLAVLAASVVVLTSSGCAPEEDDADDGLVETDHLRITTTTENPICAGTPLLLEGEVERIAAALDLPLWPEDEKLEVRFGLDAVAEVCPEYEPDDISGCADIDEHVIAAQEVAFNAPHELVHAVRLRNLSLGHPLFEEGLAQVLSGSDGFPLYVRYPHGESHAGVEEMLALPRDFSHYVWGASFVSWLWETHGQSSLMAFMNDPRFSDEQALPLTFEEHFGQTLAVADQAWATDERPDPIWGAPCIPERTYSLADGPVEITGDLDCREPNVYGASYSMAAWSMCLEVPETTRIRVSFAADHGRFQIFRREPCEADPATAEAYRDKSLNAGDVLEEDIVGCRFQLFLFSQEPGFPATPYTIRIQEVEG